MGMNSDMDRYLRERRRSRGFYEPAKQPFWSSWFAPKEKIAEEDKVVLDTMETEIKKGQEDIDHIHEEEMKLEEAQEQRVSLYERFMRLFQREQKLEEEYEHLHAAAPVVNDTAVSDDFRALAQIQMRWLDRMPSRIKEEFKTSDDYQQYVEILQRRGVVKRK